MNTQPNAEVCQHMLTWSAQVSSSIAVGGGSTTNVDNADAVGGGGAREVVKKEEDCLELYCGGGTFTSVLANSFRGVRTYGWGLLLGARIRKRFIPLRSGGGVYTT